MNDETRTLSRKAKALTPSERVALVEDVLDSLDAVDPTVDQLWAAEAADRLAAYRRGDLAAKDLGDVVAKYRP
jgi:putative addiction module component (TIGR02574 family)